MFNRLSALPDDIGRLRKLRLLDASYNKLTAVPRGLGMLEHLEVVDLSHNYISAVTTFIADPARLDLRGNPVG